MQLKNLTIFCAIFTLLLGSCTISEEEIIQTVTPQPIEIQMTTNNNEISTYIFDECDFNGSTQVSTTGGGLWGSAKLRSFGVNFTDQASEYKLALSLEFKYQYVLNEDRMRDIMSTELNVERSPILVFRVRVYHDEKFYVNHFLDSENGTLSTVDRYYTYYPDFNYEITEYEVGYQSSCEEDEAIKFKGTFEGMLYAQLGNGETDSLYVSIPEFETMVLID